MITTKSIQALSPQMAAQFANRAKSMDGCVVINDAKGKPKFWEFAQNSNVITLISVDPPMGHIGRDPKRAAEIRIELANRAADAAVA